MLRTFIFIIFPNTGLCRFRQAYQSCFVYLGSVGCRSWQKLRWQLADIYLKKACNIVLTDWTNRIVWFTNAVIQFADTEQSEKIKWRISKLKAQTAQTIHVCNDDVYLLHIARSPIHMYSNRPLINLSDDVTRYIFRYYEWKHKFIRQSVGKAAKYGHQLCGVFCKLDCH